VNLLSSAALSDAADMSVLRGKIKYLSADEIVVKYDVRGLQ
jgi:hypothetical protein